MDETIVDQKPRLGFIGVGWIGRNRLQAVAEQQIGDIRVISDPNADYAEEALQYAKGAKVVDSLSELIEDDVDGVIIATPSALHASQSIDALAAGKAVFC